MLIHIIHNALLYVQVAHPSVREHLLALIYMGFLVPVMGPALTQVNTYHQHCSFFRTFQSIRILFYLIQ